MDRRELFTLYIDVLEDMFTSKTATLVSVREKNTGKLRVMLCRYTIEENGKMNFLPITVLSEDGTTLFDKYEPETGTGEDVLAMQANCPTKPIEPVMPAKNKTDIN